MKIILDIIILLVGFVLLVKGADFFVDGSSDVAKKLKVPSIVVGLTIVAIGTSLPELAVSTFASAQNANEIAFSNVVGSNFFNLLMVLGISALFTSIPVKKSIFKREFPFLLIITALIVFLAGDALWFGNIFGKVNIFSFDVANELIGEVGRLDGVLLVVGFIGFICWTVSYALKERSSMEEPTEELMSAIKCIIYIVGGAAAIMVGGELVVNSAKSIALSAGMSEVLVGLTIVALGTSLPELVTSAVAAKKGEVDIAVGNVIGSNIANILLVLGVSSAISPVSVKTMSLVDAMFTMLATVLVFAVAIIGKDKDENRTINKPEGIILIITYCMYLAYVICRQYL